LQTGETKSYRIFTFESNKSSSDHRQKQKKGGKISSYLLRDLEVPGTTRSVSGTSQRLTDGAWERGRDSQAKKKNPKQK